MQCYRRQKKKGKASEESAILFASCMPTCTQYGLDTREKSRHLNDLYSRVRDFIRYLPTISWYLLKAQIFTY